MADLRAFAGVTSDEAALASGVSLHTLFPRVHPSPRVSNPPGDLFP